MSELIKVMIYMHPDIDAKLSFVGKVFRIGRMELGGRLIGIGIEEMFNDAVAALSDAEGIESLAVEDYEPHEDQDGLEVEDPEVATKEEV